MGLRLQAPSPLASAELGRGAAGEGGTGGCQAAEGVGWRRARPSRRRRLSPFLLTRFRGDRGKPTLVAIQGPPRRLHEGLPCFFAPPFEPINFVSSSVESQLALRAQNRSDLCWFGVSPGRIESR